MPLVVVETDKATVEVEAFRAGYVCELLAKPGDAVAIGAVVARLTDQPPADVEATAGGVSERRSPAEASTSRADQRTEMSSSLLLTMFRQMVLIRRFEDHLYQLFLLFLQRLVPGTLHQSQGQEAITVGVCAALRRDDVIFSTHPPVAHVIAKGGSVKAIAAELWGKATGCAGGKGGQMHLTDVAVGVMPTNAIVGANRSQPARRWASS